jgi:hydroxymethylpyrimidine/phosphomethylpyrimidine kinase
MSHAHIPRVLVVAASDSSGAAGVQADLKTLEARQVYGMSAITAITAQDSQAVRAITLIEPEFVAKQIGAVLSDIGADAIKTGLLLRPAIIHATADALRSASPYRVIDPVLVAGDGRRLVDDEAIEAYRSRLFPDALIITPNLIEAGILTDSPVHDVPAMREAARKLIDTGTRYVLIKGGHLEEGNQIVDLLYDGRDFTEFIADRLPVFNARGTGCTFASTIAAEIAKGHSMFDAVSTAKRYVTAAINAAADWQLGHGRGTVFHSVGRPPI